MNDTRTAFELALAADPDNLAAHSAYADWLIEQGDPRGDYIRLQLALEDRSQPPERIRAMQQESFEIRTKHEHEWLGPLYEFVHADRRQKSVVEPVETNIDVTFSRGWLKSIRTVPMKIQVLEAIKACPIAPLTDLLFIDSAADMSAKIWPSFGSLA